MKQMQFANSIMLRSLQVIEYFPFTHFDWTLSPFLPLPFYPFSNPFFHLQNDSVGNGIYFDATRDFLKQLDVVDKVWIGLKRSQGSKQFLWR